MLRDFLAAFFEGMFGPDYTTLKPRNPVRRPSRKKMNTMLLASLREGKLQYRTHFRMADEVYHAIYVYDRSAIYTAVYQITGEQTFPSTVDKSMYRLTGETKGYPKYITYFNGKPDIRTMQEKVRMVVNDRARKALRLRREPKRSA